MNLTNDERQFIILRRLRDLKAQLDSAIGEYESYSVGPLLAVQVAEKLRTQLAEIADGLGKACD